MARVTVEDCVDKIPNRFDLVLLASQRARQISGGADLTITKTDSSDPAIAGSTLTYTLTVSNAGPADARQVQVVDQLPTGATFVSSSAACVGAVGAVTCQLGTVAAASSRTFTIETSVSSSLVHDAGSPVTITNSASVSSDQPDPNPGDDVAVESTMVVASAALRPALAAGPPGLTCVTSTPAGRPSWEERESVMVAMPTPR